MIEFYFNFIYQAFFIINILIKIIYIFSNLKYLKHFLIKIFFIVILLCTKYTQLIFICNSSFKFEECTYYFNCLMIYSYFSKNK